MEIIGTYLDPKVNHKDKDYDRARRYKNKILSILHINWCFHTSQFTKKFADNHQKMRK